MNSNTATAIWNNFEGAIIGGEECADQGYFVNPTGSTYDKLNLVFRASASNSIYGGVSTVQPASFYVLIIIKA